MVDEKIINKLGNLMTTPCGLNIQLINNQVRNDFYDKILKKCKNKKCIDVGGGTGLLSLIALKHGATHITCFEQEFHTYNILNEVINYCDLQNKITLVNEKFTSSDSIQKHNLHNCDLIFHELFGSNLWNDIGWPIRDTFNKKIDIEIIPNKLISNFYFAKIIDTDLFDKKYLPEFDPGIEVDEKFVYFYNYCINQFNNSENVNKHNCVFKKILVENFTKYKNKVEKKSIKKIYSHFFDFNTSDYFETVIKFKLPRCEHPYILFPIYNVECGEYSIKQSDGFGLSELFFISCDSDNVYFELDTLNGMIKIDNSVASDATSIWWTL